MKTANYDSPWPQGIQDAAQLCTQVLEMHPMDFSYLLGSMWRNTFFQKFKLNYNLSNISSKSTSRWKMMILQARLEVNVNYTVASLLNRLTVQIMAIGPYLNLLAKYGLYCIGNIVHT